LILQVEVGPIVSMFIATVTWKFAEEAQPQTKESPQT
jgi:hypothetical protein